MYKRKMKLNSLYGQMVGAGKITKAMQICAKQVREIPCARCLHYEKCVRNGGSPVSMLGRFIAWLNLSALKPIAAELRQYCVKGLKLEGHAPGIVELEEGAYAVVRAVVRAYDEGKNPRLIFRLNLQGDEDEAALCTLVFNAYIRAKRKMNNGK